MAAKRAKWFDVGVVAAGLGVVGGLATGFGQELRHEFSANTAALSGRASAASSTYTKSKNLKEFGSIRDEFAMPPSFDASASRHDTFASVPPGAPVLTADDRLSTFAIDVD